MVSLDYFLTDYSYVELQSDYKIANVGLLEKGAKLKIEKGFSEGFSRYSLFLNLHDGEITKMIGQDKKRVEIPYWLIPVQPDTLIQGDLYFKLISFGSLYGVPDDLKTKYISMIDSIKQLDSIPQQDKEVIETHNILTENELIDKPYFHLKVDSVEIITVYLDETEFAEISKFNRQELINEGKKIKLSLQGKMIRNDIFYANEIHRLDKIDGKTYWRK
ncbi:hypothetical protein AVL50_19065 [Flammeovirga sp. SJP92]|nr:hypothetical protein AVL50_19065 [Flammeovirga sp. SJP92]